MRRKRATQIQIGSTQTWTASNFAARALLARLRSCPHVHVTASFTKLDQHFAGVLESAVFSIIATHVDIGVHFNKEFVNQRYRISLEQTRQDRIFSSLYVLLPNNEIVLN